MKRSLPIIVILILLSSLTFSSTIQEEFLKSNTFVRQMGMGGAATAVCDDMSAVFYNPAGLGKADMSGLSFGSIDINKEAFDMNHYYSYSLGSLCYVGQEKKLEYGGRINTDAIGIGVQSRMGISYGLTYKNIIWETQDTARRGYSVDVGILLNVTPQLSLGLLGQDAIAEKALDVPGSARLGVAYKPFSDWMIIAADTEIGREGPGDFTHYGIEGKIVDGFKLRAGVDRGRSTVGASLDLPFIAIHYAALFDDDAKSGTVHMLGGEMSIINKPERPMSIIRPKEYAVIDIGGSIVGGVGEFSIFGGGRIGADTIIAHIKEATKDPYIDGILLRIRGFEGGLGSFGIVQEIRGELLRSRDKGKKIVAYLEEGTFGDEYYLASVADRIVAPPSATVGGLGKSISVIRVRGLLEKLGIEAQILSKGRYKTTFSGMSQQFTREQKQMVQVVLADLYRQMVNDIAASRDGKITKNKLKDNADGSIYSSSKAKELGLIDEVGYFKEAMRACADLFNTKEDIVLVEKKNLFRESEEEYLIAFPNKVVVIDIDGDIVTGKSGQNMLFGGHSTGADSVSLQIKKASDDWQVRAIVIRINSGGGSAVASGQIYSDIMKARDKGKIVVASMGDVAASGGYYIASASDKIIANPGTITGSIGVIEGDLLVYSGLLQKLGIKVETVKEGKHTDMFSGFRKLSTEEVNSIMKYMDETYQEFIKAVAEGREMSTAEVAQLAEGKVYTGSQALDVKLVDRLGNFSDSVDIAADLAGINGEPKLVYYREENFWFNFGSGAVKMMGLGDGILPSRSTGLAEYKLSF